MTALSFPDNISSVTLNERTEFVKGPKNNFGKELAVFTVSLVNDEEKVVGYRDLCLSKSNSNLRLPTLSGDELRVPDYIIYDYVFVDPKERNKGIGHTLASRGIEVIEDFKARCISEGIITGTSIVGYFLFDTSGDGWSSRIADQYNIPIINNGKFRGMII